MVKLKLLVTGSSGLIGQQVVKDLSKNFLDNLAKVTQDKLTDKDINDHERYVLNHKLDTLKQIQI